ncbi:MAG TPA: hypothetical protein DHW79_04825 [Candidatus Cloacimonas sp.]|jgi:hypothetical protein|nr:hypothetical protein [Candidatus Cloacimonas sp.]
MPLVVALGLGKGVSLCYQGGFALTDGFEGPMFDQYFPDLAISYQMKISIQKSFALGEDDYIAVFPGFTKAKGVTNIVSHYRIRYDRKSIEVPITYSKLMHISKASDLIVSLSGRSAWDWETSDLNRGGEEAWTYYSFLDQPINKYQRNAVMAHIDYQWSNKWMISGQIGREYTRGDSDDEWNTIFLSGHGTRFPLT